MEQRYTVEQVGYSDWAVWDTVVEDWAYDTGSRDDAEHKAAQLNADAA
jgi:hypothetical protein